MSQTTFDGSGAGAPATPATLYSADRADRRAPLLVLAHGAGAGQRHPFMVRYATALAARGIDVATFDFPYMAAGRRSPDRAPVLEAAFRTVIVAAAEQLRTPPSSLWIGGKSMGGRMATHLAAAPENWPNAAPALAGVVVFGYPLNPPGGSRRSPDRVSHLARITAPTLIVQGTRDSFGGPPDIDAALATLSPRPAIEVMGVEGADHSLVVSRNAARQETAEAAVLARVAAFIRA